MQMKAVEALTNTTIAEVSSREGSSNITAAWQSINRTRDLLKHALALLITDGIRALNESILSANSTGDLAKRLIEMAAEVCVPITAFTYAQPLSCFYNFS